MLLPSFFIFDFNKYEEFPDINLPENAFLCYRIPTVLLNELDSFNKKLFSSQNKNPFCILISLDIKSDRVGIDFKEIIDSLVSFSFHYKYLKFNYDNPLIIFETEIENINKFIIVVEETFKSHGYKDIEAITINNRSISALAEGEKKNICLNVPKNINSLFFEYTNSIKEVTSADSFFFFFLDKPEKIPEILDIINQSEAIIQKDLPQIYYLLKENRAIMNKKQGLLFKIGLLQEQLNSLNNYHLHYSSSDTRYKRQLTELLNFYKTEYEILPAWYKRLGHIIKVTMGKRTFRSLFNDNVKKYKD